MILTKTGKDSEALPRYLCMLLPRRIRTDQPTRDEAQYNLLMTLLEIEVDQPAVTNADLVQELRQVIRRLTTAQSRCQRPQ